MAHRKLSDVKRSKEPYDVKSRDRLKKNLERKFKKLFGSALYKFETMLREEIKRDPELHREFKSDLFRIGNRIIQNMNKELECYNVQYIPFHIELRPVDDSREQDERENDNE